MPSESSLECRCRKYAEARGWHFVKLTTRGYPDRVLFRGRDYLLVEFKTTAGAVAPHQRRLLEKLKRERAPVYIVRSFAEFTALIQ